MSLLMPQQALSSVLEKIINTALTLNTNSNNALTELSQKTLEIHIDELGFPLCFTVEESTLLVTGITERSDCVLTTSISSLIELQKHQQLTELIKQNKLDITGDLKTAQLFAGVIENIHIDWQTEIAKHIGDIPTYKLEQLSQWLKGKLQFTSSQISADASEWLVHEQRLAVTTSQLTDFNTQVADIADSVTRAEQRIASLMNKLSPPSNNIQEN